MMKNKQALIKLAQIKLAINYVLRNRQMTKQAFWTFSPKPKYSFEKDPDWQNNEEAVKDLFKMVEDEWDQWKMGPGRKFLGKYRKTNPDIEYALANKFGLRPPEEYRNSVYGSGDGLSEFVPGDVPLTDKDKEAIKSFIAANNDKHTREGWSVFNWGPERTNYYLNRGVKGLSDLASNVNLEPEFLLSPGASPENEDWDSKRIAVRNLLDKYKKQYAGLPAKENNILKQYADLYNKYLDSEVAKYTGSDGYWTDEFDEAWDDFNYEPEEVRESWRKDPGNDGKVALQNYLRDIRSEDAPDWEYALDILKRMRKDPSYEGIKQKMLELGKKYNL